MEIDEPEIIVFYGDDTINIPKNSTFYDLKMKVLNQKKNIHQIFRI